LKKPKQIFIQLKGSIARASIPITMLHIFTIISHRCRLRTTNCIERFCGEIKRRTRVVGINPNEMACLRLISANLVEVNEERQVDPRLYLTFETNGPQ